MPFRYLIQHIGVAEEEFDERKVDAAFTALEDLVIFARQRGVEILLENIPNSLSSAERLMQFDEVTHLNLNFCFDVGHANMGEGVEPAFDIMKERIRSTHVHDNNGKDDKHLFPLLAEDGTVDWRRAMELLRSCGDQFPLLLELREAPELTNPLDRAPAKSSTVWRTWLNHAHPNHHRRRRPARRRNRRDRRLALQPAPSPARSSFRSCATARASCSAWR